MFLVSNRQYGWRQLQGITSEYQFLCLEDWDPAHLKKLSVDLALQNKQQTHGLQRLRSFVDYDDIEMTVLQLPSAGGVTCSQNNLFKIMAIVH